MGVCMYVRVRVGFAYTYIHMKRSLIITQHLHIYFIHVHLQPYALCIRIYSSVFTYICIVLIIHSTRVSIGSRVYMYRTCLGRVSFREFAFDLEAIRPVWPPCAPTLSIFTLSALTPLLWAFLLVTLFGCGCGTGALDRCSCCWRGCSVRGGACRDACGLEAKTTGCLLQTFTTATEGDLDADVGGCADEDTGDEEEDEAEEEAGEEDETEGEEEEDDGDGDGKEGDRWERGASAGLRQFRLESAIFVRV